MNGSTIYYAECEVQYVLECLRFLLQSGRRAIDCRRDVHDAYNARIDAGNLKRAWGVSNVPSWYKSASGRVSQNWPFSLLEFWQQTQRMDPRRLRRDVGRRRAGAPGQSRTSASRPVSSSASLIPVETAASRMSPS